MDRLSAALISILLSWFLNVKSLSSVDELQNVIANLYLSRKRFIVPLSIPIYIIIVINELICYTFIAKYLPIRNVMALHCDKRSPWHRRIKFGKKVPTCIKMYT